MCHESAVQKAWLIPDLFLTFSWPLLLTQTSLLLFQTHFNRASFQPSPSTSIWYLALESYTGDWSEIVCLVKQTYLVLYGLGEISTVQQENSFSQEENVSLSTAVSDRGPSLFNHSPPTKAARQKHRWSWCRAAQLLTLMARQAQGVLFSWAGPTCHQPYRISMIGNTCISISWFSLFGI